MDADFRMENIERELLKTRKSIRLFQRLFILGTILVLGGLAVTATHWNRDVVKAKSFLVIDDQGRTRAQLKSGNGEVGLALFDENGALSASIGAETSGPVLRLFDKAGKMRVLLDVVPPPKDSTSPAVAGGPALVLAAENGTPQAALSSGVLSLSGSLLDPRGNPSSQAILSGLNFPTFGPGLSIYRDGRIVGGSTSR